MSIRSVRFQTILPLLFVLAAMGCSQPSAPPASEQPAAPPPAAAAAPPAAVPQGPNLVKEVKDKMVKIQWRPASPGIPVEACTVLRACPSETPRMATLPSKSSGGQQVGRALLLVKTADAPDPEVILQHQTVSEVYFFLVTPEGTLSRAAYIQRGNSWTSIANSLVQPIFDEDKKDWLEAIAKLT